ncbi:hypothetical protein TEHD23766T_2170 [Tetragenococcus halophilus subsp. flandriensis]|nr:hypothetical protein TEHD23766T_2170 [Tetragenococcus halophilus subsp. flandriensis]
MSAYSNKIKKIFITCCVLVLLPELEVIKKPVINILVFMEERRLLLGFSVKNIVVVYSYLRTISIILIITFIFLFILYYLFRPYLEKLSKPELSTTFEKSLYSYLESKEEKYSKKGYLVSGEWGSGKTRLITDFFDKYFKFNKRPIYKISCFGLDSRELVLQETEKQIEENDNSFLNWIQFIPLVGLPIFNILKKTYSLQNITSDAIFIFDDFERITPTGVMMNDRKVHYELNKIVSCENKQVINLDLQKYNIVTGLINELIEHNDVKVIIICNTDIIGHDYMDKIFRGKLDCINYHKTVDKKSLVNIFEEVLDNQIFRNNNLKKFLSDEVGIIDDFEKVWLSEGVNNLREAKSIIQAFLDTLSEVEDYIELDTRTIVSLFYSIYVISIAKNEQNIDNYECFPIGGHLAFYLELYNKTEQLNLIKKSKFFNELQWVGYLLSGYWLLNFSKPGNLKEIFEEYVAYPSTSLEKQLLDLENSDPDINTADVSLNHVLYMIKKEEEEHLGSKSRIKNLDLVSEKIRGEIPKLLSESENLYVETKSLLISIDSILGNVHSGALLNKWLTAIYNHTKFESFDNMEKESLYVLDEYNKLAKKNP